MDWQKIVSDLVSLVMTQVEIGKHAQLSQPTISDLAAGRIQDLRNSWNKANGTLLLRVQKASS